MSREQLTEMEQKLKAAIGPRCVANARIRHLFEASRMFRIALPIPVPRSRSQVGGKANPGKIREKQPARKLSTGELPKVDSDQSAGCHSASRGGW